MTHDTQCPVCNGSCALLDVVDFNKSCEEARGKFLTLSGVPVYYAMCNQCGFCFAPEIAKWGLKEFAEKIYNDNYVLVDPDYIENRPKQNAANLIATFGARALEIKHLDYGGGSGGLSALLKDAHWHSTTYDPFVDTQVAIEQLGQFDLVTAFEVFEHVPDVGLLMANLRALLAPQGVVMFTTLLSDGHIHPNQRLSWWYASPRNGHISLFSKKSMTLLARDHGFHFRSFSPGYHALFTAPPPWAVHILGKLSSP